MSKILYLAVFSFLTLSCNYGQKKEKKSKSVHPASQVVAGYDFSAPQIWQMPAVLREISGIAFSRNSNDSIYAQQDEEGNLYHFKLGDSNFSVTKFGKKGDYEDVAISNGAVFMLRSDGTVYSFPLTTNPTAANVSEWKGLVPPGEYEGLFADPATNLLYILCKHCGGGETKQQCFGYISYWNGNKLAAKSVFAVDLREVSSLQEKNKNGFHPSALAKHPVTKQWFILSSVNKMLVVADENWKFKSAHPLDPSVFSQPEGIAFDGAGNLYISNEAGNKTSGTLIRFKKNGAVANK